MAKFLLEIGCEEIPARMIDAGREELARRVGELLVRLRLIAAPQLNSYSTPRRLTILAENVADRQADMVEEVLGPASRIAFKDGEPTPAAVAFARKHSVDVTALKTTNNAKGEYVSATVSLPGRSAIEVLTEELPRELAAISWPKNMYWRVPAERFVRPVRWVVALIGEQVVPLTFAGIAAGRESRDHRLMGCGVLPLAAAGEYAATLERHNVLPDQDQRRQKIRKALDAATRVIPGARWREDEGLLDTVVNLTEYPTVVLGRIDKEFLSLPEEILVTVMHDHQKYFAVEDAEGKLAPYFLAVLNTEVDSAGIIAKGHERVLRARFSDARFFWDTDQKIPLRDRVDMLKAVVFHKDLGSYYDKTQRMLGLANSLASAIVIPGDSLDRKSLDRASLEEAVRLAKVDLTTELVKEFTELQGIVGGLYAAAQGTGTPTAAAIYDQYKPASIDAESPRTLEGALLSISDKADTIAGMFALGLQPTGSRDPFALRRQANGVVKTIADHELRLPISEVFRHASALHHAMARPGSSPEGDFESSPLQGFFRERIEFYMRESQGFAYDVCNAVMAAGWDDVVDVRQRCQAVSTMRDSEDFRSVAGSFKRIKNILRQAKSGGQTLAGGLYVNQLKEPAEVELASQVESTSRKAEALVKSGDYKGALVLVSQLRPAIDSFFDDVMVMVEDKALRAQRLALLGKLLREFSSIADFSEVVPG